MHNKKGEEIIIISENNPVIKNVYNRNKTYKPNIKLNKSLFILLHLISLISQIGLKFIIFPLQFSNITLKIKGIGYKNILGEYSDSKPFESIYYPNEVYINGIKQNIVNYSYYLNLTDNYIELIWFNNINNCRCMFRYCSDITQIDMSNFDTSEVTDMNSIFAECVSLTSLNLSNFNTSQVTNLGGLFYNCKLLTSLDLSALNTSKATYMANIFRGCTSLTSINISHFDTSKATSIKEMFYNCLSLTSLDLSNFDTSNVEDMNNMFNGCVNLEYINLKSFNLSSYPNNFFYNIPDNIVICINDNNNILKNYLNIDCYVIDCSNDWKSKQKKIIKENGICVDNCYESDNNKYEYNLKCYNNCTNGYLKDNNNTINKCKCELEQCKLCPPVALMNNLCTECNNNYYPKENDTLNLGEYINCYKEPEGYYLDINDSLYKKCYFTCEKCDIKGDIINHNCIKCKENYYPYLMNINNNNYTNCYKKCDYYYYLDNQYNFHCTLNYSCPEEYPKLIEDKKECIINVINIKDIIDIIERINKTKEILSKEE